MTSPQQRQLDDFTYDDLAEAISPDRAERYLKSARAMDGDSHQVAVQLYQHNAALRARRGFSWTFGVCG